MAEEYTIRKADIDDMKKVFELSNDEGVRKNCIHREKIEWSSHINWFKKKITSSNSRFYIMETNEDFIGYLRLDKENDAWIITIHICKNKRGMGFGKKFLSYVIKQNADKNLIAYVKENNKSSYCLFSALNFKYEGFETIENEKYHKFSIKKQNYVIAISNKLYDDTSILNKDSIIFIKNKADLTFENLKKINPKYVFFPHWSYIIPSEIYENFNCVIFHMTDLPFGRGGSPLQNLIEGGIHKTKISAIKCVKELDAGDIYLKKDFDISYGCAQEIYKRAGEIISDMIDEIITKNPIPIPQRGKIVEFRRRKPEQSNIKNLNNLEKIYDYIRMLDADGYPKAYLESNNIKFEFSSAKLEKGKITAKVEIKVKDE